MFDIPSTIDEISFMNNQYSYNNIVKFYDGNIYCDYLDFKPCLYMLNVQ